MMQLDPSTTTLRHLEPADHPYITSVVNSWWGGRNVAGLLPRLFFEHFRPSSFVAERAGEVIGFLVGFVSETRPEEAYIHFVGVHPGHRQHGVGRRLYLHFFDTVRGLGCRQVRSITSPVNSASVNFHLCMGFVIEAGSKQVDGLAVTEDYDGLGGDRVLFLKTLDH